MQRDVVGHETMQQGRRGICLVDINAKYTLCERLTRTAQGGWYINPSLQPMRTFWYAIIANDFVGAQRQKKASHNASKKTQSAGVLLYRFEFQSHAWAKWLVNGKCGTGTFQSQYAIPRFPPRPSSNGMTRRR